MLAFAKGICVRSSFSHLHQSICNTCGCSVSGWPKQLVLWYTLYTILLLKKRGPGLFVLCSLISVPSDWVSEQKATVGCISAGLFYCIRLLCILHLSILSLPYLSSSYGFCCAAFVVLQKLPHCNV